MNNRLMAICALVVALGAGWTWWWHSLADRAEQETALYLDADPRIHAETVTVSGFPFRLQLALKQVSMEAPDHPLAPSLAFDTLHAVMQPWNLNHILFFTDGPYTLTIDGDSRVLQEEVSHASLKLSNGRPVQFSAEIGNLTSDRGERIDKLEMHLRQVEDATHQDIYIIGQNMQVEGVDGRIDQIALDASLTPAVQQQMNRNSAKAWAAQGGALRVRKFHAHWQGIDLRAGGDIALDAQLRPAGSLQSEIRGHDALLDNLQRRGVIGDGDKLLAKLALSALAQKDAAGADVLSIPVAAENGILSLGPLKLWGLQPLF